MGDTIDRVLDGSAIDDETMRQAVREAISEERISQATIAKQGGFNPSTFNAWLNGSYTGDNNRITQAVRIWLRSRAARDSVLANAAPRTDFVTTPSAEAFMSLLLQAQYEPDMVTLVGEPGVGKTEACREYQRRNSNVWLLTGEPDMRSPYAVLDALCEVLEVRERNSTHRSRAISRFLRGRQGLIIIDEAQHMTLPALDQLRTFHDAPEVRVGIALVGHPDLKTRMRGGGTRGQYAQLDSRFGMHFSRIKPLKGDVMALLDAEGITDKATRDLLRGAANKPGALRKMNRIVRAARMVARGMGADTLTEDHILMAERQLDGTVSA